VTDQVPAPPERLGRLRPIPTYRDHPATTGCDIEGVEPAGARRSIEIVDSDEPVFILFLSSSCQGCRDLWEGMDELRHALGPRVRVVVVTRGPEHEDAAMVARLASSASSASAAMVASASDPGAHGPGLGSGDGSGDRSGDGAAEVVMSSKAYLDYGVGGPPFYALTLGREVRTEGVAWGVSETAASVLRALAGPDTP
jgi:hypothetical protein